MGSYPNAQNYPPPLQSGYQPGYPTEYGNPNVGYPPGGPPPGPYGPPQPQYGPPQHQYGPPQPQYGPSQGGYGVPNTFPQGGPIMNQPAPQGRMPEGGWMNMPQNVPNCPPGLEYLTTIDQLLVHQKVELLEAFTGFETANKYTVKNSLGQKVYYAVEDTDCCTRNCCGPRRPFDMKILDNYSNEVIHLNRPLRCDSCWFPCCLQSIEVSSPPGTLVGTVEQEWSICCPTYAIKNAAGDTVLRIEGPFCTMSICGDVEFQVMSTDGSTQVGKISKQWSGMIREMFTDADYFGITFPIDLDVKMKAVMLGACFLIVSTFGSYACTL
ncbi:hypothetical protein FQR65_LT11380 [Abscondita terminalis]|nr:hypothetical protein FQR65_LT11380 [Abscondita terminalis]